MLTMTRRVVVLTTKRRLITARINIITVVAVLVVVEVMVIICDTKVSNFTWVLINNWPLRGFIAVYSDAGQTIVVLSTFQVLCAALHVIIKVPSYWPVEII